MTSRNFQTDLVVETSSVDSRFEDLAENKDFGIVNQTDIEVSSAESASEKRNPFLDPQIEKHYRGVYEKCGYECAGVFDPDLTWSQAEEKRLLRKLDLRVALSACLMFAALQIDRGNLQQAVADNMLDDLNLSTNDYNTGQQIFYAAFTIAEVPSQLLSKKIGPDLFVPIQMVSWSIVAMAQAAMSGKAGFFATRAFLGLLEGGFIADLVLWLSYFYTSRELTIRLSWFWTCQSLVQIVTALLAFAILRMRGVGGLTGWQWLLLLEGIITFLISVAAFYLMVPSAVQTKNWLHPKGWFSPREEKIVVNRILRDDPSKGDMNNRQALTPRKLWAAIADYDMWPIYAIGIIAYIPVGTLTPYLTLNLKQLGFSTLNVQLLSIPYNILHIILLLGITWASERFQERSLVCLLAPVYSTFFLGLIRWWSGSMKQAWPTYVLTTLFLGQPYIHAICVSWVSKNSNSIKSRSVSSAMYNMFVQIGTIIANQIYRADDKPLYHRGNMQLFFVSLSLIPLLIFTRAYYAYRNKQKKNAWNALNEEERRDYPLTTTDAGNRRLDFLFAY
ncbi:LANO_0G01684g1_1 [Lachancea nothofagi CBS 11611]|uniref:LANO_0G01684g1_1 n=1 Tax=Lachancea nothofagi CBS 11611 TaxID=1266666 RepID=A0A1G4KEQ5_9SACH|nr:LANO_0G01684g1_1 [Lachancea nothofagi CBS 11611]